jgi:hypothetical protein
VSGPRRYGPAWFARNTMADLRHIAEHGLDAAYDGPEDWLYDFWPSLPWDRRGMVATIRRIRADPGWPALAAAVKARIGFDIDAELVAGLNDPGA